MRKRRWQLIAVNDVGDRKCGECRWCLSRFATNAPRHECQVYNVELEHTPKGKALRSCLCRERELGATPTLEDVTNIKNTWPHANSRVWSMAIDTLEKLARITSPLLIGLKNQACIQVVDGGMFQPIGVADTPVHAGALVAKKDFNT